MDEITLELIKTISELISNLIILVLGFAFARYAVNQYQKRKDSILTRESLLQLQNEVSLKNSEMAAALNQMGYLLHQKQNIIGKILEETESEESEPDLDTIQEAIAYSGTEKEFRISISKARSISRLLLNRMRIQLILSEDDLRILTVLEETIEEVSDKTDVVLNSLRTLRTGSPKEIIAHCTTSNFDFTEDDSEESVGIMKKITELILTAPINI